MCIQIKVYKGLDAVTIENEALKLIVLPQLGAKIASLIYKPQNFEIFFQPVDGIFRLSKHGEPFADYDTAGADEMFPTIDTCLYPYDGYSGKQLPDHGDLWSIPWNVTLVDQRLLSQVKGRSLPYEFNRTITLEKSSVRLDYRVINTGDKPLYGIWAFHGLVACDERTKIILPETDSIINVHNSTLLGAAGTKHSFPMTTSTNGSSCRIDRVKPKSANDTEKIYVDGRVRQGQAALTLNNNKLCYMLVFPKEKVPYLGIWINQGGFKGEYNCALEPATGYYDSLEVAHRLNTLELLAPGDVLEWYLTINLEALP
ncbi:hypothetical protein [Sporomusa malonica]|uniref:Galactose mutarotase n=1 Tax=Sporomusa malonica TaxID=112901 RepID=A0A1W2C0P0_9FIRM|nr:hypothetical protein [Sporomusa malonica]SMC78720.1 Galactose mutarotase [Sporomusa malonica]